MKLKVLTLSMLILLLVSVPIFAQNDLLFSRNGFESKFNQKTPSLNFEQQQGFQQELNNKKQEAVRGMNSAPDMSAGNEFTKGLKSPNLNQVDRSNFEGFHFNKEQVTPNKFKGDFQNQFSQDKKRNQDFGMGGINKAKNFDNSIPKKDYENNFNNQMSSFNNKFNDVKQNENKDLTSGKEEFKQKFADFKSNSNKNKNEKYKSFDTKLNQRKDTVNGDTRFDDKSIYESPAINSAKNTYNPYTHKKGYTADVNIGEKPEGWNPNQKTNMQKNYEKLLNQMQEKSGKAKENTSKFSKIKTKFENQINKKILEPFGS